MKIALLVILSLITLLYIPLNRQVPKYSLKLSLDDRIPFLPWTVWVYYLYYLIFMVSICLLWNSELIIPYLITQVLSTAIASLIWKIFPNGVVRPTIEKPETYSQIVLHKHFQHDKDCNGLPSGHVMHTFIACLYLSKLYPPFWFIFYLIMLPISLSTLTTKQHYYLDMVTTLCLTPAMIEIINLVL